MKHKNMLFYIMLKGAVLQSVKLLIATISVAATKMIDYCNVIEILKKHFFSFKILRKTL